MLHFEVTVYSFNSAENIFTTTYNPENFLALLNFRIDSVDEIVKKKFSLAPKNAQYRAPSILNDFIVSTGEWIQVFR